LVALAERQELELPGSVSLLLAIGNPEACDRNVRFVDQDLNRCFSARMLKGSDHAGLELGRARVLAPLLKRCNVFVDLHSTNTPSTPFVRMAGAVDDADLLLASCLTMLSPDAPMPLLLDPYYKLAGQVCTADEFAGQAGALALCFETGLATDTSNARELLVAVRAMVGVAGQRPDAELPARLLNQYGRFHPQFPRLFDVYRLQGSAFDYRAGFAWKPPFGARNFQPVEAGDCLFESPQGGRALAPSSGHLIFPKIPSLLERGKVRGWRGALATLCCRRSCLAHHHHRRFKPIAQPAAWIASKVQLPNPTVFDPALLEEAAVKLNAKRRPASAKSAPSEQQAQPAGEEVRAKEQDAFTRTVARQNERFVAGLFQTPGVDLVKHQVINPTTVEHVLSRQPARPMHAGLEADVVEGRVKTLGQESAHDGPAVPAWQRERRSGRLPWAALLEQYFSAVVTKGRRPSKRLRDTLVYCEGEKHVLLYPKLHADESSWRNSGLPPFTSPILEVDAVMDLAPAGSETASANPRMRLAGEHVAACEFDTFGDAAVQLEARAEGVTALCVKGNAKDDVGKTYFSLLGALQGVLPGAKEIFPVFDGRGKLIQTRGVSRVL
jgi:hypothetical protein